MSDATPAQPPEEMRSDAPAKTTPSLDPDVIMRVDGAQTMILQWMRSHTDPRVRGMKSPCAIDFVALLIGHVVALERKVQALEAGAAGAPRIIVPR